MNKRIQKFREEAGFTKREIAKQLNISVTEYSKIETSKDVPCEIILKIAEVLNVNILKILYNHSEYKLLQKKPRFIEMVNEYTAPHIFIREDTAAFQDWYDTHKK